MLSLVPSSPRRPPSESNSTESLCGRFRMRLLRLLFLDSKVPGLNFESLGETLRLVIRAQFNDGAELEVNESTYLSFASSNPSVANVDNFGMVTATGPGNAVVTATYNYEGQTVQMSVPVRLRNLLLDVSPYSLDFGDQPVGTASASQDLTLTNRAHSHMRLFAFKLPPAFSETDDCASTPLTPGGSCTVHVTFTPGNKGLVRGALVIGNGFSAAPTQIALSGTGK